MPVPTLITDLSTTIASNSPAGSESPASLDDYQRAHAAFIAQLRDRTATDWPNTPSGTIAATTVQGAINEIVSDLSASSGSSLVGFIQAGAGAVQRTIQSKERDWISVKDFGAVGDGVADDITALNAAGTVLNTGGVVRVPKGTYKLATPFVFSGQRLYMQGEGPNVSIISFDPASSATAITYNNPAAGGLYQGKISGFGFLSANTIAKTAINLVNTANCEVSHIGIPGSAAWGGDSIGIRSAGRQFLHFHQSEISCARPLVFAQNASYTSINTDHYLVENVELIGTSNTRPVVEFETGVMHTNTTIRNAAIVGGLDGILWDDTTSVGASYAMVIENMRSEQGLSTAGYSIKLASASQALQTLTIKNAFLDSARNGIYLRNAREILLENVFFNQGSGKVAIDITLVAGSRLVLKSCYFAAGGTITITNGRCIQRDPGVRGNEEWIFDAGTSSGNQVSDVYHQGSPVSLAVSGTAVIAANNFTGIIFVSTSEDVSAIYNLLGPTNGVNEIADPNGFFTNVKGTASSVNIYYEAGNYMVQNNRPASITVSIYRIGTTA